MKIGSDLSSHGIHFNCWFGLTRLDEWAAPGQTKTTVFVVPKCTITSVICSESPRCRWQIHKCMMSGICCRETSLKFLTWAKPKQKRRNFPYPEHTDNKQSFTVSGNAGKRTLRMVPFEGLGPPGINSPKRGTLTPQNDNEILFIHPVKRPSAATDRSHINCHRSSSEAS